MNKNILNFLAGIAFATGLVSANAQTATAVTIPQGMITYTMPHATTNIISLPLSNNVIYTSTVTAVNDTTITVSDSPAPFTSTLLSPNTSYFVKFMNGNEMGRVVLITANDASDLTLDTTDNTNQTVSLTTAGFNVAVGDTFEIFAANTLASVFGNNSAQSPLVLTGSASFLTADTVAIYNAELAHFQAYYFNAAANCWQMVGSNVNANNTILYPYGSLTVLCRSTSPDATLVLSGRVAEVPVLTKTTGTYVFCSTGYAVDMTLAQVVYGSNWLTGSNPITANTVSVFDAENHHYDAYYQMADSTWRLASSPSVDASNTVIAAGSGISIAQRAVVTGSASFLSSQMPYSVN